MPATDKNIRLPPMNLSQPGPQSGPSWEHRRALAPAAQRRGAGPEAHAPGVGVPLPGPQHRLLVRTPTPPSQAAPGGRGSGPGGQVCQAHLLLQLVLVALPGQLVLVLGPLGEGGSRVSSAPPQRPLDGALGSLTRACPPAELLRAHADTRAPVTLRTEGFRGPAACARPPLGLEGPRTDPDCTSGPWRTPPRARVPAALTAWCCRVSSLRVLRRSSACTRICSLFSCSTAASYSCGSQLLRARPPAQDTPSGGPDVPSPPPGGGQSAGGDAHRAPRPGRARRRTHFELGLLLQLQRLLLHLRQAQRLLGVSCGGARALGHRAGPR